MAGGKNPIHGRSHWLGGADPIAGLKIAELDVAVEEPATGTPTFSGQECQTDFSVIAPYSIFVPALTVGQIVVVLAGVNETRTLTVSDTGWTELVQGQGVDTGFFNLLTYGVWWHRASGDEAATSISLGVTSNPQVAASSAMWVLGGGDIGDYEMNISTGTGTTADAPSVTAETADATLLCAWVASRQRENAGGGDYGWTTPGGMTADCTILQGLTTSGFPSGTYNGDYPPLLTAHEESVGIGDTGVRTSTHDTGLGGTNKPILFSLIVEDAA